ncbi:hypothetical protein CI109_100768 [Kwoniella shandongensis]|uniref:GDS1 winged helix domain-containing protein n=1 Tax=Kwoniella shandongensis TaxID=1734106 RepID=A0A5M6BV84_9TREE|nr:uncharacterized protein CI109_005053 [Kwoniella shandongensis]KAA5526663.1 hypothetical protein CI109_005053 [Kwoniella shandongensis]
MARPIRPAPAPTAVTPISAATTSATASSSKSTPRTSHRSHRASTSTAPSTPLPSGPLTPSDSAGRSSRPSTVVEAKAHGLRSVGGASERTPCPFPAAWGGKEKCGISDEDEADDVLMSILGAIASYDNRALSAEEIASTCFQQGWLRPPSAAIEPTTLINNSIRSYLKRCEKNNRHCLLSKHQLAGSVVESVLESALHPNAFDDNVRPKGTVWFLLSSNAKGKWKNPFDGLEIPKVPPRKPAPPKKPSKEKEKENKVEKKTSSGNSSSHSSKGKAKAAAPVKIRLVLNGATTATPEEDSMSEMGSSARSRSVSMAREGSTASQPAPAVVKKPAHRKVKSVLDDSSSSSDSDSSDSEIEINVSGPSRLPRQARPLRKAPPPPLNVYPSPRLHNHSRLPQHSPFMDLFYPSPSLPSLPTFAPPHSSPFPSHSLDNTTWTARHDRSHHFESSSSSSDDEMRDLEWGASSDIIIKAPEDEQDKPNIWSMEEDEANLKEATDALRVLFPMSNADEEVDLDPKIELNKLDNRRSSVSESSGLADAAVITSNRGVKNQLKAVDCGSMPLNCWINNSSPVASPNLRMHKILAPPVDFSPTQHLSKLRGSFDTEEMDVDEGAPWLDESGELPVKAEDTFSDVDLNSTIGDAPTPEHDRQLHTALWAQEAAATMIIKQEPEDYPSPITTDQDDQSAVLYHGSRGSSTPSSGSSELPPFEIEGDNGRMGLDEVILGPESVTVEELDGWLPTEGKAERTPHRGRAAKSRHHPSRCSGNWGGIGVGNNLPSIIKQPTRTRSTRSNATMRRRKSSSRSAHIIVPERLVTPETDICDDEVDDAIGTADLEKARVEAEAREEQHRKACKEKAEQQRAMLEAYRQTVRAEIPEAEPTPSPWSEYQGAAPWGSTDSLHIGTPGALSPMALHSLANMSLGTSHEGSMQMMAVDPKALVSPPIHGSFGAGIGSGMSNGPSHDLGAGMLDAVLSQQEVDAIMSNAANPIAAPSPIPPLPPASASLPTPAPAPPPAIISPQPRALAPAAPAPAPTVLPQPIPKSKPTTVPTQPTAIPIASSAPHEKNTAMVALPTTLPKEIATLSTSTTSTPLEVPPKSTPSPTSSASTTSSNSMPPPQAGNGKSGGKIATITKPLCPGVDACVVDNIPVYAHLFEGKDGSGRQVLLRRLDTDFVNANALLLALDIPETAQAEYLDKPISQVRLAARHIVPPSTPGAEYSQGVSGTWVHLSEARDFAKRAKLQESSLLSSVLREDLFQLFATLAGLKPDHPPSETFGLPFVARRPPSPPATNLSATNSKSAPNLSALSTSAPAHGPTHLRQSTTPSTPTGVAANTVKGPLVRSAPPTPPDGCPQPKRRRATISSPLAKKPQAIQPIAPAPSPGHGQVPAAGTRLSVAQAKRATRASIGGAMGKAGLAAK